MTLHAVLRDEFSAEFFDATAEGRLLVRRCVNGHYLPPSLGSTEGSSVRCFHCQAAEIAWVPAAGTGTLVSWIVTHLRDDEGGGARISGLIELDEGPWMYSLLDVESEEHLSVGLPLTVGFVPTDGGEVIPTFRPA